MDEFIEDSTSPKHFGNFNSLDIDHNSTRHSARHHSNSCSAGMYDRSRKGQNDTDHWKEKARTCEKGIGKIYQMIQNSRQHPKKPPTFTHNRSASMSYQFDDHHSHSPSPAPDPNHQVNGYGSSKFDDIFGSIPSVSISELQSSIERLLLDQGTLLSRVDDLKQIADAAKRERVLAIDEKDQMLRETHSLRVAVDTAQAVLGHTEEERDVLKYQVRDLQDNLVSLKRDNEKAREMRSLALEERSKIIAECSELQQELLAFRDERDELYKETQQQQTLVDDLLLEKQRLEQDLDWMAKNGCESYEGLCGHKEENPAPAMGKGHDVLEVSLNRLASGLPWGFTFEGGQGSEFYHQDPSIVITGVANNTPAVNVLRFGDRVLSFGSNDFRGMTKKEAAEAIRSCDFTTVSMEIGRATANIKPTPQEVKIPGKKDFGFSYESRLYVTSTDEDSPSSGMLLPGDEILQVQSKSAFNMKPSALKQLLKSCKDGVTLTVQRQPGINLTSLASTPLYRSRQSSGTSLGSKGRRGELQERSGSVGHRQSSDLTQSPGTPKSSISECSAGYHSLAHSVPPSESSNTLIPVVGPDSETGQIGPELDDAAHSHLPHGPGGVVERRRNISMPKQASAGSLPSSSSHPHRPGSVGGASYNGLSRSSYRNRPSDFYLPKRSSTASHSTASRPGSSNTKPRSYSMTTFKGNVNHDTNNRIDHTHRYSAQRVTTPMHLLAPTPVITTNSFSMSADNLDSDPIPPTPDSTLSESHAKSRPKEMAGRLPPPTSRSRGHLSISMGNMQTHV